MSNSEAMVQSDYWIQVHIPGKSETDLGFQPHTINYTKEVLQYFAASTRVRWYGHGRRVRPSEKGDILEETTWDFGVGDLENAIKDFKVMFREHSFPSGTTITKVTKHPDLSFSFEILLTWSGSESK